MEELWVLLSESFDLIMELSETRIQAGVLIGHLLVTFESAAVEVGIRMLILTKKKFDDCTCSPAFREWGI